MLHTCHRKLFVFCHQNEAPEAFRKQRPNANSSSYNYNLFDSRIRITPNVKLDYDSTNLLPVHYRIRKKGMRIWITDMPFFYTFLNWSFSILIWGYPHHFFKGRTKIMLCIITGLLCNFKNREVRGI